MRSAGTRLATVGEEDAEAVAERPVALAPRMVDRAIAAGVMLALKTLSQKTIVALAALVDLALMTSAFALWINIIVTPTLLQLSAVGMYALFVLAAIYVRHR